MKMGRVETRKMTIKLKTLQESILKVTNLHFTNENGVKTEGLLII